MPLVGLLRYNLTFGKPTSRPFDSRLNRFKQKKATRGCSILFGTPCGNRTHNGPLGGGCYIHLTKEANIKLPLTRTKPFATFAIRNARRSALKIQVRVLSDSRLSFTVRYILAQLKLNFNLLSGKYTAKLNILPETFFISDYPKGFFALNACAAQLKH